MKPARLVFLGGLGEVGRNCAVLELEERRLLIDCGLSFPEVEMPGIDLVLPDFDYLRKRPEAIDGAVLTHGHEDHIGALPYLLREASFPVYGTRLTLGILRGKLEEHRVLDRTELIEVAPGSGVRVGPFSFRFLAVTHSIPDGVAVAIDTPHGTVLHTGDFRLDQTPIDGRITDLGGLAEEASRGVHLLLSDSTNAEDPGFIASERTVGPALREIIRTAPRLVVVACFASHIHRVQQVCDAAAAVGRVVAFLGRSMLQNVATASSLGYLHLTDGLVIPIEDLERRRPEEVVVVSTGSQGEPYSALSLMAAHEHKWVRLEEGDTVVLSSSLIPGNEAAIHRTIDGLYRTGAEVFHQGIARVHVSGHAAAEELKFMLNLIRPRWFVPVHGERRHLSHHARLAREVGILAGRVLICEDGDVVEIGEECRRLDRVQAGVTFVDGLGIGDVGEAVLRDRRKLAGDGFVVAVVTIDGHTGEVLAGPDLVSKGFVYVEGPEGEDVLEMARSKVVDALERSAADNVTDPAVLKQSIRQVLGRHFSESTKRKPVVIPVIMEV